MNLSPQKKIEGVYCCAYHCKKKPGKNLGGLCSMHYQRKRRQIDPVGQRFTQAKVNAAKRPWNGSIGIPWTITLPEFRNFCKRTGYMIVKGRRGQNATLDRLCNVHGYHIWNIGLKTNRQNASKGCRSSGDNFDCPF